MAKFDFEAAMEADGVRLNKPHGCLEDDRFYYRFTGGDVQVAVKANFDRWANSVDFVFAPPKTANVYKKIKAMLATAMASGRYDRGIGMGTRL